MEKEITLSLWLIQTLLDNIYMFNLNCFFMNYLCCKVDSICHMGNSDYYSLMERMVISSTENTQYFVYLLVAIILIFLILLLLLPYFYCNMTNKNREYQNVIACEISKLNQTLNCSISTIRNFSIKNSKCDDNQPNNNEYLIKLYFLLVEIHKNIESCCNNKDKNKDDQIDELFKYLSNHTKIVTLLDSFHFADNTNICELLDQFEVIAKKIICDCKKSQNQEYDTEIKNIKDKLNYFISMLKDLLNIK